MSSPFLGLEGCRGLMRLWLDRLNRREMEESTIVFVRYLIYVEIHKEASNSRQDVM